MAAAKSLVLLKNDGVLPLDRRALRRIAVIGTARISLNEDLYHGAVLGAVAVNGIQSEGVIYVSDTAGREAHAPAWIRARRARDSD